MKNIKLNKTLFVWTVSVAIFALGGFYIGSQHPQINYSREIEVFTSCASYEENFLVSMGFKDRNDCIQFNKELEDDYKNDCLQVIKKTDNQKFNETSLNACIYHSFSKARTSFDSNYYLFKHSK